MVTPPTGTTEVVATPPEGLETGGGRLGDGVSILRAHHHHPCVQRTGGKRALRHSGCSRMPPRCTHRVPLEGSPFYAPDWFTRSHA